VADTGARADGGAQMSARPRSRVAYLLAASHSGSTLTAMLLNSHPEVVTAGELKITALGNIDAYRCSCGSLIRQCDFWAGVTEAMRRRGQSFDIARPGTHFGDGDTPRYGRFLRPLFRGGLAEHLRDVALALQPGWRAHVARTQAANSALIESVLEQSGKKVIVDSSKIGIRLKYLLRNPDLDVRVVRLVRDGRAVALTYMDPAAFADAKDPSLRGGGSGGDRRAERLPVQDAAREWLRSNEEAEALRGLVSADRWIDVRYEEICNQTDATLRRIFAFLGVDPDAPRPNFRAARHHVIGNGMRLDTTSEVRVDERWRQALTADDLREFDIVAGQFNRRMQYT
jgi:hypothetical protein